MPSLLLPQCQADFFLSSSPLFPVKAEPSFCGGGGGDGRRRETGRCIETNPLPPSKLHFNYPPLFSDREARIHY